MNLHPVCLHQLLQVERAWLCLPSHSYGRLLLCDWTLTTSDISSPSGPRAVSPLRSWRSWSAPMIFTHKGQRMFIYQAARPLGASISRCSGRAAGIVSHQLPKQLPKLHLMPIKTVSRPLPLDSVCNIKNLSDPFNMLTGISAEVLQNSRWTPSASSCVCVWI